jgi:hypothetical protein
MSDILIQKVFRHAGGALAKNQPVIVVARDQDTELDSLTTNAYGMVSFYIGPGQYDFKVLGIRVPFDAVDETGPQGPPGPPGESGAAGAAGTWISGEGPPTVVLLEPLDGVNDPWRWSNYWGAWISPAYEVTWEDGITLYDMSTTPLTGTAGYDGVISPPDATVKTTTLYDNVHYITGSNEPPVAVGAGSGIYYLVQYQADFNGTPIAVPHPEVDPLDYLVGAVVTGPYPWPDAPDIGVLGQFYKDTTNDAAYGPKTEAGWGSPWPFSASLAASVASLQATVDGLTGSRTAILVDYAPPPTDGSLSNPGDYYYDGSSGDFYGPRGDDGTWPFLATFGLSPVSPAYIQATWGFAAPINAAAGVLLTSPDLTPYRLVVANDGTLSADPA